MSQALPQDRYVKIDQVNTRFWALGEEGDPVVLVHGLGGFIENWVNNVQALAGCHRVYAPDLVGFGRSDKPKAGYSLPFFARFLRDFLDSQGIERATLVGNSLGGGICLQSALDYPERVEALVLVSSAGLGKEVTSLLKIPTLPLLGEYLTRPSREGAAQALAEMVHDPTIWTQADIDLDFEIASQPGAQQAFLRTARRNIGLRGVKESAYRPILDNLSKITMPTLIIWGLEDPVLPVAHAYIAKERIANSQLCILDKCGHVPMQEYPEAFNQLVLDFLEQ